MNQLNCTNRNCTSPRVHSKILPTHLLLSHLAIIELLPDSRRIIRDKSSLPHLELLRIRFWAASKVRDAAL
ncbi:hypothetical protein LCGC14_0377600 [marine sediment metagenome]|uniref:Uncharacterized protein n=1 Tax=marine sediment metagenome TaxID=412755 RepID=A0A0F9TLG5_9ZZZZ